MNTSMKGILPPACSFRASSRSALYGEMKAVMVMAAASEKSFATCSTVQYEYRVGSRKNASGRLRHPAPLFTLRVGLGVSQTRLDEPLQCVVYSRCDPFR